jgi:hypothetical protein
MEPNVFLQYHERGNSHLLNPFGHEQYPFNNLDQNNSDHVVSNVTQCIAFFLGFVRAT